MAGLVIRGCSVLVVPEAGECSVEEARDIHVEDGAITAITPAGELPAEGEVVDAVGLIDVPGLINSHTHSPMVMMRGAAEDLSIDDWFNKKIWPMEVNLTPERVRQLDGDLRPVSTAGGRARLYPVGRIEHLAGLRDARGQR